MQYSEECIGTCGFSGSIICERDDKSVQNRKLLANKIFNKTRAHKYFAGENSKNETKKPKKNKQKVHFRPPSVNTGIIQYFVYCQQLLQKKQKTK